MPTLFDTVLARAAEPSTWRGFVWLLSAGGIVLVPEHAAAITAASAAVAGAIGVLSADRPGTASETDQPVLGTRP